MVELESGGQGTTQPADALDGPLTALVAADLERALADDADLDLIAFLELERFDHGRGQTYRQTVTPLSYLHNITRRYTFVTVYPICARLPAFNIDPARMGRWRKLAVPPKGTRRSGATITAVPAKVASAYPKAPTRRCLPRRTDAPTGRPRGRQFITFEPRYYVR